MRKLATVRTIEEVRDIEGADRIQAYRVDGWWVVDQKGAYQVGDQAVYCEVDSWIPYELAPFLSKGAVPKEYQGIKGNRLKTIRLKGQISQGLLLNSERCMEYAINRNELGDLDSGDLYRANLENIDLSAILGIEKWEPPVHASLGGICRSTFPSWCRKTDQERCQNMKRNIETAYNIGEYFEVTVKMDGSSMSVGMSPDWDFVVCSRNQSLVIDQEGNSFVDMAKSLGLDTKLGAFKHLFPKGFMIQGELMGEGIQKNKEQFVGHRFFVFDIYDVASSSYINSSLRYQICTHLGLEHVPVLHKAVTLRELELDTIDSLLLFAEGKSYNPSTEREGVVFKSLTNDLSFKAISNRWLPKNEE